MHWAKADARPHVLFAQRDTSGEWRKVTTRRRCNRRARIGQALLDARSVGRDARSPSCPATTSNTRCWRSARSMSAFPMRRSRRPIRWSPAISASCATSSTCSRPGWCSPPTAAAFARAIEAVVPADVEVVVVTRNPPAGRDSIVRRPRAPRPTDAVDAAHDAVGPDTIAKFLFTSGSTGMPKGVINTQRMWCANQVMLRQALAVSSQDEPPVILDWAPWHHTAGGNHDVGLVLYNGGTFYIDDGKPMPGAIEETVRNLREIAPTWYFNVPKGYEALLPYLRDGRRLARETSSAASRCCGSPARRWRSMCSTRSRSWRCRPAASASCSSTGLGSTETAPFALARTWPSEQRHQYGPAGAGLDAEAGADRRQARSARARARTSRRATGASRTTPRRPSTRKASTSSATRFKFADPRRPDAGPAVRRPHRRGLQARHRHLGQCRAAARGSSSITFAPYVRDVVIAGADRDDIARAGRSPMSTPAARCARILPPTRRRRPCVGARGRARAISPHCWRTWREAAPARPTAMCRAMLLAEPPSLDVGEMTDKGSINQRAVLSHRAALVEEIYADAPSPRVIRIDRKADM